MLEVFICIVTNFFFFFLAVQLAACGLLVLDQGLNLGPWQ